MVGEPLIGHEFSFYKELFKVCSLNSCKVHYNEPPSARKVEPSSCNIVYKKGEMIEPEPSVIRILFNGRLKYVEECLSGRSTPERVAV